jgi:hypothetical protein
MLAASHALMGASLAKIIPNPYLAIPVSIMLHFVADLTPHWDLHTRDSHRSKLNTIVVSLTDAGVGFLIGWLLFSKSVPNLYLLAMMFLAQLPDWIEAPYRIFNWRGPFLWMKKFQSRLHYKQPLPWGLVWQLLIVTGFIALANL